MLLCKTTHACVSACVCFIALVKAEGCGFVLLERKVRPELCWMEDVHCKTSCQNVSVPAASKTTELTELDLKMEHLTFSTLKCGVFPNVSNDVQKPSDHFTQGKGGFTLDTGCFNFRERVRE